MHSSCDTLAKTYYTNKNFLYLTNYLEVALKLNCTKVISDECNHRKMSFTKFTDLVYDRACNRSKMIGKCHRLLIFNSTNRSTSSWENLIFNMRNLSAAHLQEPCTQIALYDRLLLRRNYSYGMFHEVRHLSLPFCEKSWCGLDDEHKHLLSPGFCLARTR